MWLDRSASLTLSRFQLKDCFMQPVVSLDYVPKMNMLVSGSTEGYCKLWFADGTLVGVFGVDGYAK